jgi:hypothetical protein
VPVLSCSISLSLSIRLFYENMSKFGLLELSFIMDFLMLIVAGMFDVGYIPLIWLMVYSKVLDILSIPDISFRRRWHFSRRLRIQSNFSRHLFSIIEWISEGNLVRKSSTLTFKSFTSVVAIIEYIKGTFIRAISSPTHWPDWIKPMLFSDNVLEILPSPLAFLINKRLAAESSHYITLLLYFYVKGLKLVTSLAMPLTMMNICVGIVRSLIISY